ncbi:MULTISPECIES: MFS transporter [Paenibacillus]|uniref:Tetracycline resistance protein n=1 Tax=Paenibacillus validus TaxID=44253 RepID=A0A7X2ZCA1_9BACL|nr:MFS transporter [Paenibacillus validus]MUG72198.1 MFS transporter [Paenibacillus validus]
MLDSSAQSAGDKAVYPALDVRRTAPWIMFIIFFAVLNETVFNVSMPSIAEQYGLTPSGVSWVSTTFIIFFAIGSVIYGKLSDIFSLKKLIVIGIVIYNVGSLLGYVCQFSYPLVVLFRAVQGAGASAIPALIMVLIARYFSMEDRGKVFGILNSTVAFAVGIGPVIGGFVSSSLHWSYLFLIPVFTLISLPFFNRALPSQGAKPGKVDVAGAVLIALGVAALILFSTESHWYWLLACVGLLGWFTLHIRRTKEPFIEPSLFKNVLFRNGLIVAFIIFCTVMGIMYAVPFMLDSVKGLSANQVGWVLFPGAISAVLFGPIGGSLADKRGNPFVVSIGILLLIASLVLISSFVGFNAWLISGAMVLTYIGLSFIQTAIANSVSRTLTMEETGVGMGLFNLVGFISGAVGMALVGRVLAENMFQFKLNPFVWESKAWMYSNLMLLSALVIVLGALLYYRSYGRAAKVGS